MWSRLARSARMLFFQCVNVNWRPTPSCVKKNPVCSKRNGPDSCHIAFDSGVRLFGESRAFVYEPVLILVNAAMRHMASVYRLFAVGSR
jgi:hypothetical protein